MTTLWERIWSWGGGTSLSLERSTTRPGEVPYLFVLLLRRRFEKGTRAAHFGVLYRGRRPIGVAVLTNGVLRERRWA